MRAAFDPWLLVGEVAFLYLPLFMAFPRAAFLPMALVLVSVLALQRVCDAYVYPQGVIVKISVACDNASQNCSMFPRINPDQPDATAFTFMTRGIWFDVIVGDNLPAYMYRNCCVSSPEMLIFVGDFDRFVTYEVEQSKQTARILA
jgi:hypothetical protein